MTNSNEQINAKIRDFGKEAGNTEESLYKFLTACAIQEINTGETNLSDNHQILSLGNDFYHVYKVPTDTILSITFHDKNDPLIALSNAFNMNKEQFIQKLTNEVIDDLNSSMNASVLYESNNHNQSVTSIPAKIAYHYPTFLVSTVLESDQEYITSMQDEISLSIINIINNPEEHLHNLSSNMYISRLINSHDIEATIQDYVEKIESLSNFDDRKIPIGVIQERIYETNFVEALRKRGRNNIYEVEFQLDDGNGISIKTGTSIHQLVAINVLKELTKPENLNKIQDLNIKSVLEQSAIKIDNQFIPIVKLDKINSLQRQNDMSTLELCTYSANSNDVNMQSEVDFDKSIDSNLIQKTVATKRKLK